MVLGSVFSVILWLCLAAYLDSLQVSADERLSFFYPIISLFSKKKDVVDTVDEHKVTTKAEYEVDDIPAQDRVDISHLTKIYNGASTKAVNDVSLSFHKGEIFGLLG